MEYAAVAAAIKEWQLKLASINANWNGQFPDVMSPADAAKFAESVMALHQSWGAFVLKAGGCLQSAE